MPTNVVSITRPRIFSDAPIELPLSKSISNRALIISAIGGFQPPSDIARCDDTESMTNALRHGDSPIIDIGAAGTAMRFLTAYFALQPGRRTLTGSRRMLQRPIGKLVDALRELGADITYEATEGFPPLHITGTAMRGGCIEIDGGVSSQFVSALLMIGPAMPQGLTLRLRGCVVSRPYIDMTLRLMRHYGSDASWTDNATIRVAHRPYRESALRVEADWSAASYWYETVALASRKGFSLRLHGLSANSIQGDSVAATLFRRLGVETEYGSADSHTVLITNAGEPTRDLFEANLSDCPDLAQSLIVACAMKNVPFRFSGLESLAIKETDRGAALQAELHKMGVEISVGGGIISMDIQPDKPHGADILTYDDHRMAMAFAPAAAVVGRLSVRNPEVVSKSYPDFWTHLQSAGFSLKNSSE